MTNVRWSPGVASPPNGQTYVLDISTGSGSTQMFFSISWPSWNAPGLTQGNADDAIAAVQTAVSGISGVTSVDVNPLNLLGTAPVLVGSLGSLTVDGTWRPYVIALTMSIYGTVGTLSASLVAASPGDGILTSADVDSVVAAAQTVIAAYTPVTECDVYVNAVSPSTV